MTDQQNIRGVSATADSPQKSSQRGLLVALIWSRGILSAIAFVGVVSTLGGDQVQRWLQFSDALTRKWNDAVFAWLGWLSQYVPIVQLIDRHELNILAVMIIFGVPALSGLTVRGWKDQIASAQKAGVKARPYLVVILLSVFFVVVLMAIPTLFVLYNPVRGPDGSLRSFALWFCLAMGIALLWVGWPFVRGYAIALVAAVSFILTLDALYYAPLAGDWIARATEWLNNR
jgi:hypothetical protein